MNFKKPICKKKGLKEIVAKSSSDNNPFYHKPKKAIKHLMRKKEGECIAALYREDIGDINIIWGDVSDPIKHTGFGLSHIIDKHGENIKKLGFCIEDFIPIVVQYGNFNEKKSESDKKVFESNGFRFVVAIENKAYN